MLYRHDIEASLGPGRLARVALQPYLERALAAAKGLARRSDPDLGPLLALPRRSDDLPSLIAAADRLAGCDRVLSLGIGGSSLGGQALAALADPRRGGPRLSFLETVDPAVLDRLIADTDWARAGLLLVSKSGGSMETLAQAAALLPPLLATPGGADRVVAITAEPGSPLGSLARERGFALMPHEPDLGGRFSVFSATGLVPARLLGLDLTALRAGAAEVLDGLGRADCAPAWGAALAVALLERCGAAQQVFFVYGERLAPLALWFRQLWAESLGKSAKGQTPLAAFGPADQHSLLQLFLDGPRDKAFTLVSLDTRGQGPALSGGLLAGKRAGDLLWAEAEAAGAALAARGLPVRHFHLDRLDEAVLGALLMHFMLETVLAGVLIGVDPFGQPAVEEGKALTRRFLAGAP